MFKGWDVNLTIEKLIPKVSQQSEACLEACSKQVILFFQKLPIPCAGQWSCYYNSDDSFAIY